MNNPTPPPPITTPLAHPPTERSSSIRTTFGSEHWSVERITEESGWRVRRTRLMFESLSPDLVLVLPPHQRAEAIRALPPFELWQPAPLLQPRLVAATRPAL